LDQGEISAITARMRLAKAFPDELHLAAMPEHIAMAMRRDSVGKRNPQGANDCAGWRRNEQCSQGEGREELTHRAMDGKIIAGTLGPPFGWAALSPSALVV
jgi:hypothetical protein